MKKIWPWLIGIGLFVLLGTVLLVGAGFLRYAHSPVTMMGDRIRAFNNYDGSWMNHDTTGETFWAFPVFSVLGTLLMFALPVGIVALIVMGIILLVRASNKSDVVSESTVVQPVCSSCGKDVQQDWKVCPHCGEALEK